MAKKLSIEPSENQKNQAVKRLAMFFWGRGDVSLYLQLPGRRWLAVARDGILRDITYEMVTLWGVIPREPSGTYFDLTSQFLKDRLFQGCEVVPNIVTKYLYELSQG